MSSSICMLKWNPAYMPWLAPQKLASQVYELISWNSRHITTRPVASLDLWIENELPLKLKFGQILSNIFGNTYSLRRLSLLKLLGPVQPYIKISFYRECPWKSQYNSIFLHSKVFLSICFMALHSGKSLILGAGYYLFRSWQLNEHL